MKGYREWLDKLKKTTTTNKQKDPTIQEDTHFSFSVAHKSSKWRGWKRIFYACGKQKKVGTTILIFDKIDFKTKTVTRDKVII